MARARRSVPRVARRRAVRRNARKNASRYAQTVTTAFFVTSRVAMAPPSKACATRLTRELRQFRAAPPPLAPRVHVDDGDLLEWFVLIQGARDTPYERGWYVMKIKFKPTYPFAAPAVSVLTPNGRFAENQSICMSMTEWHQESWNPAWSSQAIVTGFISFMSASEHTSGGVRTTDEEKRSDWRRSRWRGTRRSQALVKKFPELADAEAMKALETAKPG